MEEYVITLSKSKILGVDILIFVMLGTQKQSFERLLNYIENSKLSDQIIVQAGYTKFKSEKMEIFDFISYDEIEKNIKKADLIITHGGTGSIIDSLKYEKKVIACARLKKYQEHIDDHQLELINIFAEEGYLLELNENKNLDDLLNNLDKFKPKKYISNSQDFIDNLVKEIDRN